mmetsp:Transcript_4861/g.7033  ORF Transcript_4861/g.7033 Transcript_4861/m.7033 type:complete len:252 (+) Transcript_4861:64-819(+)
MFTTRRFSKTKLKTQLKLAVHRFEISANKKNAISKQQTREIAVMLAEDKPKEEKAMIRVEGLIREQNAVEAYEILQLSCELLASRVNLIGATKECPPDMISSIATLIWAADRVDITELSTVKKQFVEKYGKKFELDALKNNGKILNERVLAKLSFEPPTAYVVQCYMERICEQYEVDWKPKNPVPPDEIKMSESDVPPVGYSMQYVVTGTTDIDSEANYSKGGSGNDGYGGLPTVVAQPISSSTCSSTTWD